MKKLKFIFLTIIVVAFTNCSDDDESTNSINIFAPNLIEIEHQPTYTINDILWINSNFSRFLNQSSQSNPLDIYTTTNGASFGFSFGLEKKNPDNSWTPVNLENKIILNEGNISDGYNNRAECIYDPTTQTYKFRAGIPLETATDYRIFFGYTGIYLLELESNDIHENATHITINTSVTNAPNYFYYFSVE